jgi:hypothetical protein
MGSLAICVDAKTFANEPCSTTGVLAVPYSFTATGYTTRDKTGGCHARTQVATPLPPSALSPIVSSGTEHFAVSQSAKRIDAIVTSLTGAANSYQYGRWIYSWIYTAVGLKQ